MLCLLLMTTAMFSLQMSLHVFKAAKLNPHWPPSPAKNEKYSKVGGEMAQLGVLRARPHQRCKPPISHGVSLKSVPPQSAEPRPTGLGREGVLVGRGDWQQGSGKDTVEGVREEG